MFGRSIRKLKGSSLGYRFRIKPIFFRVIDSQRKQQILHCYFQSGQHQGLSKGLYQISKELNFTLSSKTILAKLRKTLANHPAFKVVSSHPKQLENSSIFTVLSTRAIGRKV